MYKEAQKDLRKKLEDFTRHHKAKDAEMQRKLKAGEITQAQYQQWITGQVFVGNQWKQKIEQVNNSIKGVMQNASHLTHGKSMDVFAENANYTAYQLEKDLGANVNFGLYDTSTVSRLVGKDPEILPRRVVNGKKLEAWETKKISNAISQGIIQGEGIDQIANRIARDTCIAADHSSVMYARTAMTAAQNSGRIERLHEAEEMGIRAQKRWMATLDDRTRDSHRDMDGETVDMDEKFSNGLMYPGDPATNDFAEICNCRCTMVYVYPEFTQSFERSASLGYGEEGHHQYETVKDMTYREWEKSKRGKTITVENLGPEIVQGTGIEELRSIAERSIDKYDFWLNLDENQQAVFKASGLSLDDAFDTLHGGTINTEWKTPTPGGAESFAIKHDFTKADVEFNGVRAKTTGWMADANTAGVINVREDGIGEEWEFIIGHEAGHQLADFSDEIQQMVIMNPGNVFGRYNLRLMAFDGVYGEYNPEEAFATCVSNFIRHPDIMKDNYPKAYEAIDTLFKTSPSALDFVHRTMDKYRKEFL